MSTGAILQDIGGRQDQMVAVLKRTFAEVSARHADDPPYPDEDETPGE